MCRHRFDIKRILGPFLSSNHHAMPSTKRVAQFDKIVCALAGDISNDNVAAVQLSENLKVDYALLTQLSSIHYDHFVPKGFYYRVHYAFEVVFNDRILFVLGVQQPNSKYRRALDRI